MNIEKNQGISGNGVVFGYDHDRLNFINWGLEKGEIVVLSVEADEMETDHGDVDATRRDAETVAETENGLENSSLMRALLHSHPERT